MIPTAILLAAALAATPTLVRRAAPLGRLAPAHRRGRCSSPPSPEAWACARRPPPMIDRRRRHRGPRSRPLPRGGPASRHPGREDRLPPRARDPGVAGGDGLAARAGRVGRGSGRRPRPDAGSRCVLQSGDVALVGPSGAVGTLSQVVPAIADWHELPRGVLVASRQDLLVVGGVDGTVAAVQRLRREALRRARSPSPPSRARSGRRGRRPSGSSARRESLFAWSVTSDVPATRGSRATVARRAGSWPGAGKSDRGIAWADMQGEVRAWKGGALRTLVRLPGRPSAGRCWWPTSTTRGDLKLVAAVDGTVAALVTEDASGGFLPARPAGGPSGRVSPVALPARPSESPPVLAMPAGADPGQPSSRPTRFPPGSWSTTRPSWTPGAQIHGYVPGAVHGARSAPRPRAELRADGRRHRRNGRRRAALRRSRPRPKSGFGCSTVPVADALPLLLAPLLLLRLVAGGAGGIAAPKSGEVGGLERRRDVAGDLDESFAGSAERAGSGRSRRRAA